MEPFKGKKLLLADDDAYNIYAMLAALEDYGFEIITASNGREAVDALETATDVDLVLMDIMMPGMDGYEAMQLIRQQERHQSLPIIALTAKAMQSDIKKCMDAGATGYMSKPVDIAQLVKLIGQLLQ